MNKLPPDKIIIDTQILRDKHDEIQQLQELLAAERDAFAAKNPTSFVRIEKVQELLAAEREAREAQNDGATKIIVGLQQQLAEEQQQRRILAGNIEQEVEQRTKELQQQLKAAVEAMRAAKVDFMSGHFSDAERTLDAALAKLGTTSPTATKSTEGKC